MGTLTEVEKQFLSGLNGYLLAHGFEAWTYKIQAIIDRLQAPAEPKPVPKRNPELRTLQHGIAHGLGSTRYYFTADRILHEDRRKAHLQEPAAPSHGEARVHRRKDDFGTMTYSHTRAQQAQVADRETIACALYNYESFAKLYPWPEREDRVKRRFLERADIVLSLFTPPSPMASREGT